MSTFKYGLKQAPNPRPEYYPSPDPILFGWGRQEKVRPVQIDIAELVEQMSIGEVRCIDDDTRKYSIVQYLLRNKGKTGLIAYARDWKYYVERVF